MNDHPTGNDPLFFLFYPTHPLYETDCDKTDLHPDAPGKITSHGFRRLLKAHDNSSLKIDG